MPARDRDAFRNVRFYNASTGACAGGFHQNGSVTERNALQYLGDVLLIVEEGHSWNIQHRDSGRTIAPTRDPLVPGDYDICSTGSIQVATEPWFTRLISHSVSGREDPFRNGVRARDWKCVISGVINREAAFGGWDGFETAHIFPLEKEKLWIEHNYGRWIKNMPDAVGVSKIHSVQNGLLMTAHLHLRFDQYLFSINPDDDYKITEFGIDSFGMDGRVLDPICRDPNNINHASDELLRWHFRQSVLANMRGVGEPLFESDFPPGSDMMGTLREELYGKERFEMELESRLRFETTNNESESHPKSFGFDCHAKGPS